MAHFPSLFPPLIPLSLSVSLSFSPKLDLTSVHYPLFSPHPLRFWQWLLYIQITNTCVHTCIQNKYIYMLAKIFTHKEIITFIFLNEFLSLKRCQFYMFYFLQFYVNSPMFKDRGFIFFLFTLLLDNTCSYKFLNFSSSLHHNFCDLFRKEQINLTCNFPYTRTSKEKLSTF